MSDRQAHVETRVASLDLLRGIAASSVALAHFFMYNLPGTQYFEALSIIAVEIFFVLSGYVLAPQIIKCVEIGSANFLGIFLTRRWMRTIPAYLAAVILISVLFKQLGSADFFRYVFYLQNFFRQSNSTDYYSVAWSLSVEEWFYVFFPALLLASSKLIRRHDLTFMIAAAILFIFVISMSRALFGDYNDWGNQVRTVVAFRIDSIVYGFLLYVLSQRLYADVIEKTSHRLMTLGFLLAGVLAFGCILLILHGGGKPAKFAFPYFAAMFGSLAILLALKTERWFVKRPKWFEFGLLAGKVSYSIYLFHLLFLIVLQSKFGTGWLLVPAAIYIVLVPMFAWAFYNIVEKPILAARPSFRQRTDKLVSSPM